MSSLKKTVTRVGELSAAKQALLRKWLEVGDVGKAERDRSEDIPRRQPGSTIPLSFPQLQLWFLDRLLPGNPAYNYPMVLRLRGPLNISALEETLNEIIGRHESLRTTFIEVDGKPLQVIAPEMRVSLKQIDLRPLSREEQERAINGLVRTEAERPFDVAHGPLWRVSLVCLTEQEHVLLLLWSHLVMDGSSADVFLREFSALYGAHHRGERQPKLPALPIQYADFSIWQRSRLQGEFLDRQLSYWRDQLATAATTLNLPTDRPRSATPSFYGDVVSFTIPATVAQAFKRIGQSQGATLFMTLMAAFNTLLYRYSGQEDILVGTPIANRTRPQLEGLIGHITNTLVLRTDLSGNPPFRELLDRVKKRALGAYAHQDLPFEMLVEELRPDRSLSHNPLFQVMFVLQKTPALSSDLPDGLILNYDLHEGHTGATKFDLWLSLAETGEELSGLLEYSKDLFERDTIERMVGHFRVLLDGIAADPDQRLSELPLLTEAERTQLLSGWNETSTDYPGERTLPRLLEAQVERTPEAIAVVFEGRSLTYRELNKRANQLAHYLRQLGVGPEVPVGVCVDRSLDLVVALLGVLKAGGAYLPLDPTYPPERLAFMLSDAQVPVLLTQGGIFADLPPYAGIIVCLDTESYTELCSGQPDTNPDNNICAGNLAYIIYTSGSTGLPKGVMNIHGGIVNRLLWMQHEYKLTAEDRVLQKTPYSFDVSVWEFFWPLLAGARLVVARPDGHRDNRYLAHLIQEQAISTLHFVPSMLQLFLTEESSRRCTSLRRVICSGEALRYDLQVQFFATLNAELHNLYGPTEAAIDVTYWACERDGAGPAVPIGRPIANTQIYLLDRYGHPVPTGVPGELYIGGMGLARGYYRRPGLTAEKFIPNRFSSDTGSRLYRTGDLARFRRDGVIEYLGRLDSQVKLRGLRIELDEISTILRQHPTVREAVVQVRKPKWLVDGESSEERLIAYVVIDSNNNDLVGLDGAGTSKKQVAQWTNVFDEVYGRSIAVDDSTFNIAGWTSSYTGEAIPEAEMREWVDRTVERVLSLQPRRVLEIGCGTGLLLFRVAPRCESYTGMDVSETGLAHIQRQLGKVQLPQVTLSRGAAYDLSMVPSGSVDTVILNSVIQYFPSVQYLVKVLDEAQRITARGGHIMIGDVRSLPLLEAFHASVELYRASASASTAWLRKRIAHRVWNEQELVLDPAFFDALRYSFPRISGVEIQPKRGRYDNELSRFRYDVILHLDNSTISASRVNTWEPWSGQSLSQLRARLIDQQPDILSLIGVLNKRLSHAMRTLELIADEDAPRCVDELRSASYVDDNAIDPGQLCALADELGYEIKLYCSVDHGPAYNDVIFFRTAAANAVMSPPPYIHSVPKPLTTYANRPLRARLVRELEPEWRSHLKRKLPEYMVPSIFVPIDELPLTPNGKFDPEQLPPPPPLLQEADGEFVPPRTAAEKTLAKIWGRVLGLEKVGVIHNYFQLGGDSIRSIEIVSRAAQEGLKLSPRDIFRYPTIAELASLTTAGSTQKSLGATEIEAAAGLSQRDRSRLEELLRDPAVEDAYPLAVFQQQLLQRFLANPQPGLGLVQRVETLRGSIDVAAVKRAWHQLSTRFEALRTSFIWEGLDAPLQVVHQTASLPFETQDWRTLTTIERDERLAAYLDRDRELGCAPAAACPMRLLLAQVNDTAFRFVQSFSYLLIDGWTLRLIWNALVAYYNHYASGEPLELEGCLPHRNYLAWLHQQGTSQEMMEFWRRTLRGFRGPTPLLRCAPENQSGHETGFARQDLYVPSLVTEELQLAARQRRIPANMFVQAAWALLLSRYTGEDEATFGVFVAGRSAAMPGIEMVAGSTMNVLPLRVRGLDSGRSLASLLDELMTYGTELTKYEHTPVAKIREWSGITDGTELHDSYLVFQNLSPTLFRSTQRFPVFFARIGEPLRVDVVPGAEMILALSYHRHRLTDASATRILRDFYFILKSMVSKPEQALKEVMDQHDTPSSVAPMPIRLIEGGLNEKDIETTVFLRSL